MRKIHISQLVSPCVTRARGEEASNRLDSHIGTDRIAIEFDGVEMVSLSFLDGFVAGLVKSHRQEKVIFVTNPQIEEKLARISGIRNATLYCCLDGGIIQRIVPKSYRAEDAVFVPSKEAVRR